MLDGNASRYPLRTTNVRIGRHRDNDICLQNDSISRRHALLHFNADNRRFVITDLGGDNGVIVNKVKQQSHELSDGDLVELGEVRLRFRVNTELRRRPLNRSYRPYDGARAATEPSRTRQATEGIRPDEQRPEQCRRR